MLNTLRHVQLELRCYLLNKQTFRFKKKESVRWISDNSVRVRFAPSPTGQLHLGGFRTALYNYLFARKHGGKFLLRIEDTDRSRLVPGAATQMHEILDWLGTSPDESPRKGGQYGPYVQSERIDIYRKFAQQLIDSGAAYRCFCTEKRLDLLRKESAKMRTPNIYDRRCLHLTDSEIREKLSSGTSYTVRFKLTPFTEGFDDLVYGETYHDVLSSEGDPIILKTDGYPTYHLANVVDDHLMKISHVLRGVEWQVSTPKHILMYKALGWEPPKFGHLPLILNPDGSKLSKRQNDVHISCLREKGFTPDSILNFVSLIGGGFQDKEYSLNRLYSLEELVDRFDPARIHHNPGRVEMSRLGEINSHVLKNQFQHDKESLVKNCKKLVATALSNLDKETDTTVDESKTQLNNVDIDCDIQVENRLSWAMQRIQTLNDLVQPEFMFLWTSQVNKSDTLAHDLKTLQDIVTLLDQSEDFKAFHSQLKKYCKRESVKTAMVMKDIRVLLTGRREGPPLSELYDLLGKQDCLYRMERGLTVHFTL